MAGAGYKIRGLRGDGMAEVETPGGLIEIASKGLDGDPEWQGAVDEYLRTNGVAKGGAAPSEVDAARALVAQDEGAAAEAAKMGPNGMPSIQEQMGSQMQGGGAPNLTPSPAGYDAPAPGEPSTPGAAQAGDEWAGLDGAAQRPQQMGGGPRFAKVTNTDTQTQRQVVTPGLTNALDQAREERALALGVQQERMEGQVDALAIEAEAAKRKQGIEQAYQAHQVKRAQERKQYVADLSRKREAAQDRFMLMEVDPENYWQSQSTGSKITKGIGMLLSGIGSGMQGGGENLALKQINQAIADDIAAQRDNIRTAREGVSVLDGALANYRQEFDDDSLAEQAAYMTSLRIVDQEIGQLAAGAKQQDVRLALEELSGQLKAQEAERLVQFEQAAAGQESIRSQEKVIPIGGGGAAPLGSKEARLQRPDLGIPGFVVDDIGAASQVAENDTEYAKLRGKVAGARQMRQALKTLTDLRERYGAEAWNAEVVAQYNTARESYITGLTTARGQGGMMEKDWERSDESVPQIGYKLDDLYPGDRTLEKLKGAAKSIDAELNAWGTSAGGHFAGTETDNSLSEGAAGDRAQANLGAL
jgi:hypothetical protein